jgi:hypothetical protein
MTDVILRSSRVLSSRVLVAALLLSACGGAPATPPETAASTKPSAAPSTAPSAAPTAAPTATPEAKPEAKTDAKPQEPVHDVDSPDGIRRWALWDGPKTGTAITTKKAWVIAPNMGMMGSNKDSFAAVRLKLVTVAKADANEVLFEDRGNKYAVPAALARAAEAPKGLKKGAYVVCNFGASYALARVDAVDAKSVTCVIRFMDKTRKEKVAPDEVLAIGGPIGLSSPALIRFEGSDGDQYDGVVLATSGDDAWVHVETQFGNNDKRAGRYVHKVKTKDVMPIDVSKPLAKGAPCLATNHARIEPCTVKEVIEGGLAYVVSFGEGDSGIKKEWEIGTVAPAPKNASKRP